VLTLALSPDSRRLASGSWDKTVQVLDAASGQHLFTYNGHSGMLSAVVRQHRNFCFKTAKPYAERYQHIYVEDLTLLILFLLAAAAVELH
jgi:hypothetical protein